MTPSKHPAPGELSLPGPTPLASDGDAQAPEFRSVPYLRVIAQAKRFARDWRATILLEGESGTGKTRLARQIHDWSPRAARPFNIVVLSTLDDPLAGSELFGHVVGAFTGAHERRVGQFPSTNGGTIFLDEIGKASLSIQQKLLHVVETGELRAVGSDRPARVDVRVVAATNLDLEQLADGERFLPDLYARLRAFRVHLPSLRDRRADIPPLVTYYVRTRSAACGYSSPPVIDRALMAALKGADWPHNLRELDATIHRILVDAEGASVLTLDHCLDDLASLRTGGRRPRSTLTPGRVSSALRRTHTVGDAADLLGVDRRTLQRFRRRHPPDTPGA